MSRLILYILRRPFLASVCFKSCENGDMEEIELNVLCMRYLSLPVATESAENSLEKERERGLLL